VPPTAKAGLKRGYRQLLASHEIFHADQTYSGLRETNPTLSLSFYMLLFNYNCKRGPHGNTACLSGQVVVASVLPYDVTIA
jgi:hypothetical protein